ncbi:acyl-CoA dehydrogenase family protein [Henriciella litoralis]|uniref:acyl-CoA dehydrogenase family protein n=1 Tax=Henriciella litoralis TaxID=568102 RepID=UPI000A038895|nr:acyl-CoA dehydrogenase family protein [Henriciella litoralis]
MNFAFAQDTLDLRDGARSFLDAENDAARLRDVASGGDRLRLWPKLAEMGLLGLLAPEAAGGLDLPSEDVLLFCEEVGRACLPEPFSETAAVLIPALRALGCPTEAMIEDLVSGARRGIIAHPLNPYPNFAEDADFALAFLPGKVIVSAGEYIKLTPQQSIDPGRRLCSVTVPFGKIIAKGELGSQLAANIAARGACAAAAELCGLAARMIELATEYSKVREQFGQPIGSFQAVKHLMANAQVRLEFARPAVYRAGTLLNTAGQARDNAVAHAKIAATDAAMLAAENAIQVFGGMGYTFEVDLHFYMKRVWALAGIWGDRNYHQKVVDGAVLKRAMPVGPGNTFMQGQSAC